LNAPRVESRSGQMSGSRREPEVAAESHYRRQGSGDRRRWRGGALASAGRDKLLTQAIGSVCVGSKAIDEDSGGGGEDECRRPLGERCRALETPRSGRRAPG
jgi:hypothetical protein